MNKQNPGIEWTHVWGRPGYTWNPVSGCHHDCKWTMPNGVEAVCYAGTVANRVAQAAYPYGFGHHYWNPERLEEPVNLKEPAGIFLDSMSDLMGTWVPGKQIQNVLDVCARAPQHIFFLLTKNAPRLLKFDYPDNVWVGASMPPDYFMGAYLTQDQKKRILIKTLDVLDELRNKRFNRVTTWMSFEPLSWGVSRFIANKCPLDWAVIGAASDGKRYYQPEREVVNKLLAQLWLNNVPVFFKGNLQGNPAAVPWREEFPENKGK